VKKTKTRKRLQSSNKKGALLLSVAASLGSTLGVIAAKAGAARDALRPRAANRRSRVKKS
jgi:hypothetical protein